MDAKPELKRRRYPKQIPAADEKTTLLQKLAASRALIPVVLLIMAVLGSIYSGIATATEAAAVGVVGALLMSALQGSMSWTTFREALMGATRLYCMIALILAGAVIVLIYTFPGIATWLPQQMSG